MPPAEAPPALGGRLQRVVARCAALQRVVARCSVFKLFGDTVRSDVPQRRTLVQHAATMLHCQSTLHCACCAVSQHVALRCRGHPPAQAHFHAARGVGSAEVLRKGRLAYASKAHHTRPQSEQHHTWHTTDSAHAASAPTAGLGRWCSLWSGCLLEGRLAYAVAAAAAAAAALYACAAGRRAGSPTLLCALPSTVVVAAAASRRWGSLKNNC